MGSLADEDETDCLGVLLHGSSERGLSFFGEFVSLVDDDHLEFLGGFLDIRHLGGLFDSVVDNMSIISIGERRGEIEMVVALQHVVLDVCGCALHFEYFGDATSTVDTFTIYFFEEAHGSGLLAGAIRAVKNEMLSRDRGTGKSSFLASWRRRELTRGLKRRSES